MIPLWFRGWWIFSCGKNGHANLKGKFPALQANAPIQCSMLPFAASLAPREMFYLFNACRLPKSLESAQKFRSRYGSEPQ